MIRELPRLPIPDARVDERDTLFARAARRPGSQAYADYYARHPELRSIDDKLRRLPRLMHPGGRFYDAAVCAEARDFFGAIDRIDIHKDAVERGRRQLDTAGDLAAGLKELARSLGAVAAGCCAVDPMFVYSHRGRRDEGYGEPIEPRHAHALVFLVEMDHPAMQQAPRPQVLRESARQYLAVATIAKNIAAVLRASGVDARAHYDAHYEVLLVPLAIAAGLGELGRHNLLIADRFGARVRIGAVTLSQAVTVDSPVDLGAARFCELCKKCARSCPAHALSAGERETVRGVRKWPTGVEKCYGYWRSVGSDCGICMAVCPYSHRSGGVHGLMRGLLKRAPWLARPAIWGDDLLYGARWRQRPTAP